MAGRNIVAICQYGGEFITNSDGSLSYAGGEAHAIEVGNEMLLEDFKAELSTMFNVDLSGMFLKYFLPNNRRTLITISTDKDLRRMVDFSSDSLTTEVYILSKAENRARSTVAHSGTSIAADARGNKRKRLPPGNRATRSKTRLAESDARKLSTTTNIIEDNNNNGRQKRPAFALDVDDSGTRAADFGNGVVTAFTATPINMKQQKLSIVEQVDGRVAKSIMDESLTPFMATLVTPENVQPLNSCTIWDNIITGVGQEFDNVKDFRAQLCKYAIGKGFVYKFVKNETTRVTAKCKGENCPWRVHASESSHNHKFIIKKINNVHTCGGGHGGDGRRRPTRQWLTSIIKEKLHANPQCKAKDLVKELHVDCGVILSYSQVWRGMEDAKKELYQTLKETYSQLPWFCERILETNPGSVAILSASMDSKFRRFFVAFHASLNGFERGCRPLLFLDRIPLKASNEFKLLAAAAVDGDDAIFPLAFAIVEDETYDSWLWFLMQLKYAVTPSRTITFISSRHKGLAEAVPQVFVESPHSYCLHNLLEEFKGELSRGPWSQQVREAMVGDFTRAAQACSLEEFNASIESIRNISNEAANWVMASNPENWSDALFKGSRYDHYSSNILDFFSTWIPIKRESSIVHIIDSIRGKLTEMIESRREVSSAWFGSLTPSMEQKLEREASKAGKLNVLCSSDTVFEVRGNTIYVVNIGNSECTCRRWQLSGIPCMHAVAVFNRIGRSVYDYCMGYFKIDCYHLTYSDSVHPIPDIEKIDFNFGANSYPPPSQRPPGKPRRRRMNYHRKTNLLRLCSRCKMTGHNKATCEAIL
uniref:SWIM-type domain-containing protein n=1 Tax=Ananas comosus var. bracteatus TaxID=296719 RepID=A0A6V7Q361_ANACO|nr:unnamed protein product [Ananas comosus var. bracteatus]